MVVLRVRRVVDMMHDHRAVAEVLALQQPVAFSAILVDAASLLLLLL